MAGSTDNKPHVRWKAKPSADAAASGDRAKPLEPYKFKPGQSGNPQGRPVGSRVKLGEAFLEDMLDAWQRQGKDAITRVINTRPQDFLKVVAAILPKEVKLDVDAFEGVSDDELVRLIAALRSQILDADESAALVAGPSRASH